MDTAERVSDQTDAPGPRRRDIPEIRAYPDGPFLVRGDVQLTDAEGVPIPARRRVVALCRCGHSAIAPFCDGNHKLVRSFGKQIRS